MRDRQQGQNGGRQTPVGAGRLHLALQPEALADDVRQARENLAQVAAGLLLQQHRRSEEAHVQQRHPHAEIAQRDIQRRAQVLLVEQRAEFLAQRIGHLLAHHFQADGEGVAGAHGARQKVERLGKLLLQRVQPLLALVPHIQVRQRRRNPGPAPRP